MENVNELPDDELRQITLLVDSLFLARNLTADLHRLKPAEGEEPSEEFRRVLRLCGKAWSRYDRRADELKQFL